MRLDVTVVLYLSIFQNISLDYVNGFDLVNVVLKLWCSPQTTIINQKCFQSIIDGYLSMVEISQETNEIHHLCKEENFTIQSKIPIVLNSVNEFEKLSTCLLSITLNPEILCHEKNNGSHEYYLDKALQFYSHKPKISEWLQLIAERCHGIMKQNTTFECISYGKFIEDHQIFDKSPSTFIPFVMNQIVLHLLSGIKFNETCNMPQSKKKMSNNSNQIIASIELDKLVFNISGHKKQDKIRSKVKIKRSKRSSSIEYYQADNNGSVITMNNTLPPDVRQRTTLNQFRDDAQIMRLDQVVQNSTNFNNTTKPSTKPTDAQKYGWGSLAVFIICIISMLGVIIIPLGKKKAYQYFIVFFVALGIGTLLGDAILHLIPQIAGLESHDPKDIGKLIGILLAILGMYILETCYFICKKKIRSYELNVEESHSHSHSHIPDFEGLQISENLDNSTAKGPKISFAAAMIVIAGDSIHNFADGLAIGAAFTTSLESGIAMSIAVFCHELPHELGDFAILLASGMKWRKVLIVNFASSLTAFIGLYIGIYISSNSPMTQQIIFVITVGMFLYVALTDMLPSLKEYLMTSEKLVYMFQIMGIILGYTIMALVAFFEDLIRV